MMVTKWLPLHLGTVSFSSVGIGIGLVPQLLYFSSKQKVHELALKLVDGAATWCKASWAAAEVN